MASRTQSVTYAKEGWIYPYMRSNDIQPKGQRMVSESTLPHSIAVEYVLLKRNNEIP